MPQVASIDIGPLFGSTGSNLTGCDACIWRALRETGSFVITGFPEADQVDRRARIGLRIFDLPREEKRRLATALVEPGNPNLYRGYWPRTPQRLLQNEFFDVGPDTPEPGPDLPGMDILTEPTPWPRTDPVPGWREEVRLHYAHLNIVAQALILSIGRSAGFAPGDMLARFTGAHSTLRFLNYPAGARSPVSGPDGTALSAGRHVDESGLSLLWQDRPGLQAEAQDGTFHDIPALSDAISVHVGSVMTGLTGGAVPATPHRVLASDRPRRSVGFFLEPRLGASVTAADRAEDTVAPQDTYAWQLLRTFAHRPHWQGRIPDPDTAV